MRNVMIMSDNGIETPYELDYTINPKCKKFNKNGTKMRFLRKLKSLI